MVAVVGFAAFVMNLVGVDKVINHHIDRSIEAR